MVLPGFQDAHVHACGGGLERNRCDLSGLHSRADYLTAIQDYAAKHPEAEWITGGGWSLDQFPAERLSLPAAIAAFTIGSAYINHDEREAGSIEPGKRADLVVLDRNLFAHPTTEIGLAQADLTIVDGVMVHQAGPRG